MSFEQGSYCQLKKYNAQEDEKQWNDEMFFQFLYVPVVRKSNHPSGESLINGYCEIFLE